MYVCKNVFQVDVNFFQSEKTSVQVNAAPINMISVCSRACIVSRAGRHM